MRPIYLNVCPILLKGDAQTDDSQSSEQLGSQDQGSVIKGDENAVNTGTQVEVNTAPRNLTATAGSTINVTDSGAIAAAGQAVQQALAGIAAATSNAVDVAKQSVLTGQQIASDANAKSTGLAQAVIGANTTASKAGFDWKVVALFGLAIVGAVVAIVRSTRK